MQLSRLLEALGWRRSGAKQRLAQTVAADCRDQVWGRVRDAACTMGVYEARGYVRARAASVLAAESVRVAKAGGLVPQVAPELASRAAGLLVGSILRDIRWIESRGTARRKAA